jgi:hypothetical protein
MVIAGGLMAASGAIPAQAANPSAYSITIGVHSNFTVKPYTLVVYSDTTVHDGLRWNQARISGEVSGAQSGDIATLYAEPFGAKSYSPLAPAVTLTGASPESYSFTVAPTLATKYQVRVSTTTTTDATSSVLTVYVTGNGAVKGPHTHCKAGRCTDSYTEYSIVPASAYRTEAAKHWFFYFESGLKNPKYLYLDKSARTSKPRKIKATEFSVTFTFSFKGSASTYWWGDGCTQDSLSRDGLGLPGHHGCGAKSLKFSATYVG